MPSVKVNGARLHYTIAGNGPETLVLAHGLLMSSNSYRDQLSALGTHFRVVAYDHRGHGRSEVTPSGYDMDTIAEDAAQLIEHVGGPVHFGGLSMGGFVALRLAARRPALLKSVILMSTSADASDGITLAGRALATNLIRTAGFGPIAKRAIESMYGKPYLKDQKHRRDALAYVKGLPRSLWRPLRAVIDRPAVSDDLRKIDMPTLVVLGECDTLLPPAHSVRLARGIRNATLVRLPGTGHLLSEEQPAALNRAILEFLAGRVERSAIAGEARR